MRRCLLALLPFLFLFSCKPKPTCSDKIHNQGETLIDCGGPCKACPTCFDGIQNQGEADVDCGGGVCTPCQTCSDGIQNQGEVGVDCGGPCTKCPIRYPMTGIYGQNLLRFDTITVFAKPHVYSAKAILPTDGSTLKVIIRNDPGSQVSWWYELGTESWSVGGLVNTGGISQALNAAGVGHYDIKLYFLGWGTVTIEFYEDGATTPTRVKSFFVS